MRERWWLPTAVGVIAIALLITAMASGNSKAEVAAPDPTATTQPATHVDKGQQIPVVAPGVTSTEIRVGGVAAVTNPLGGRYGDAFVGAQAYFDMVNRAGGIYGRRIVLSAKRDDNLANNKSEVGGLLTEDHVFAVVPVATLLFTGAQTLVDQNVPTFGWTVNPEWGGTKKEPRLNMFGQTGSYLCFTCAGPSLPWLAQKIGAHRIGVLAYTVSESKDCATGIRNAFAKYGKTADAEIAFSDQSLAFGVSDLSVQVSKMKKAHVDLVTTCMDTNGVVTLAKEIKKQRLAAVQYLPNGYDQTLLDQYGDLFEGSYVRTDYVTFENPDKPKALVEFLDAMKAAGKPATDNAMAGWLNADLFVQGLRRAGPRFSRQKLIDAINTMKAYDAGGIIYPVDWRYAHTEIPDPGSVCQVLSKIHDSQFVPAFTKPGKPFACAVAEHGRLDTRIEK